MMPASIKTASVFQISQFDSIFTLNFVKKGCIPTNLSQANSEEKSMLEMTSHGALVAGAGMCIGHLFPYGMLFLHKISDLWGL